MIGSLAKKLTSVSVALSLVATPAIASASAVPVRSVSPMVALSIFGSQASAAALCGASSTTTAASAAATAQTPAGGCVLPLIDTPPPVAAPAPVPAGAPLVPVSAGFGLSPLLLGLAGIAVLAALIAGSGNKNNNNPPVSVN